MFKIPGFTVTHKDTPCDLYVGRYADGGGVALQLVERATGEPWAKATANLPDDRRHLGPDEVFIKDYSENVGMMDALALAGVATDTGRRVVTGYVMAVVARLTPAFTQLSVLKIDIPDPEAPLPPPPLSS